ncbi:hypothetical protein ACNKHM_07280 [Shigella sonnei]
MRKVVNIINAMEPEMEKLSGEELKGKTAEFRARLEKGEVLESPIPEAFAVVREASNASSYASLRRSVTRRYGS